MTQLRRIALIDDREFFPKAQTLVDKHLHKAVEPPIIIYHPVADAPLVPLLGGLVFLPVACVVCPDCRPALHRRTRMSNSSCRVHPWTRRSRESAEVAPPATQQSP